MSWSAGSVLGPYICAPFNQIDDDSDVCSSDSQASLNTTDVNNGDIPYIFWPWLISAVLYILAGILTIIIGFKGYRKLVQQKYPGKASEWFFGPQTSKLHDKPLLRMIFFRIDKFKI